MATDIRSIIFINRNNRQKLKNFESKQLVHGKTLFYLLEKWLLIEHQCFLVSLRELIVKKERCVEYRYRKRQSLKRRLVKSKYMLYLHKFHILSNWRQIHMLGLACEIFSFFMIRIHKPEIKGVSYVFHFKKMRDRKKYKENEFKYRNIEVIFRNL